jgi:thioesterase domain-containing protein
MSTYRHPDQPPAPASALAALQRRRARNGGSTPGSDSRRPVAAVEPHRPHARLVRMSPVVVPDAVFCAPAVGGSAWPYAHLGRALAGALTVYAVHAEDVDGSRPPPSIQDIALRYLTLVRQQQPSGPYRLAGWSMGGLVAFEMCRQLEGMGEEISLLALLDTTCPVPGAMPPPDTELAALYVTDAAASVGQAGEVPPGLQHRPIADQLAWAAEHLAPRSPDRGSGRSEEWRARFDAFRVSSQAVYRYRPQRIKAPAIVVSASASRHPARHWDHVLAEGWTHRVIDASHHTLLRPPQVAAVADALHHARPLDGP